MQHKHMQTSMFDSVDKDRRENKSFKCETRSLTMTHEQTATKNIKKNQHHGKKKKKGSKFTLKDSLINSPNSRRNQLHKNIIEIYETNKPVKTL